MYDLLRCVVPGCDETALYESQHCAAHHPDPDSASAAVLRTIAAAPVIKNLNAAGLRFEGADISGKRFYSCSFSKTILKNVTFAGCVFRMCFFDFSTADSCNFSGIDAQFCSFAGARFLNASFEHSELVHNNFDGAKATDCTFSFSNLYNSHFIMAEFEKTDFIDCNLKRSMIFPSKEIDVSWRLSNTQEAIRELDRIDR